MEAALALDWKDVNLTLLSFAKGMALLKLLKISELQFLYLSNEYHHNKPAGLLKKINLMLAFWFSFGMCSVYRGVSSGEGRACYQQEAVRRGPRTKADGRHQMRNRRWQDSSAGM